MGNCTQSAEPIPLEPHRIEVLKETGASLPVPPTEASGTPFVKPNVPSLTLPVSHTDLVINEIEDTASPLPTIIKLSGRKPISSRRVSVSAEVWTTQQEDVLNFTAPVHVKTSEVLVWLDKNVRGNPKNTPLFGGLDDKQWSVVRMAFRSVALAEGATVIRQGDEGFELYVLFTGSVDFFVQTANELKESKLVDGASRYLGKHVLTLSEPGNTFGELALMYDAPRAATVKASTDCVFFALDRDSFRNIVLNSMSKKRHMYESILRKIDILVDMEEKEINSIANCVRPVTYEDGAVIIKQGDTHADSFFMIEDGRVSIEIDGVQRNILGAGDYFGELALISGDPRNASVIAFGTCNCVTLDRESFNAMFGPLIPKMVTRISAVYQRGSSTDGLPCA